MAWTWRDGAYRRMLMGGKEFENTVEELVLPAGDIDLLANCDCVSGYYVVAGKLQVDDRVLRNDALIWIEGGSSCEARALDNVHAVRIVTSRPLAEERQCQVIVESEVAWSRPLEDGMTASRHMIRAEDWGVKVQTCIYTRGFRHMWHSHAHAHLIFVLEGMLRNDFEPGQDSFYGPGECALTPAGQEVLHEPAPGPGSVRYLFVGDGPFDFIVDGKDLYQA